MLMLKRPKLMANPRNHQAEHFMRIALDLAERGRGRTSPNPPVGAVLVRRGAVVGKGWHRKAGGDHAEVAAIKDAGLRARGATLYVTLEPCSTTGRTGPCTDAVITAGIAGVAVGAVDPNPNHKGSGISLLRKAGLRTQVGVLKSECDSMIAPFAKWIETGLPYVTLKMAMSLDGRTTDRRGRSQWISCGHSRDRVRRFRGKVDAVLVGSRTVVDDDPALYPIGARGYQPLRVTLSTRGTVPIDRKLFKDAQKTRTVVVVGPCCTKRREALLREGCGNVLRVREARGRVSLRQALRKIAGLGVLHIFCEGGAELAAGLLREGLVDRLQVYSAPMVLGDEGAPVLAGVSWTLAAAPQMAMVESRQVGSDLFVEYSL